MRSLWRGRRDRALPPVATTCAAGRPTVPPTTVPSANAARAMVLWEQDEVFMGDEGSLLRLQVGGP